jgi:alpha-D-xyloside xylohydrolase
MQGFRQEGNALIFELNHETVRIEAWGRDSLRVRATIEPAFRDEQYSALLEPARTRPTIEIADNAATIRNGALRAEISNTGKIRFVNVAGGAVLLEEDEHLLPFGWPPHRAYRALPGGAFRIEVRFAAHDDEHFYGLGQQQHGRLDHKGCVIELEHHNTQATIPWVISSRGYGLLWNNPSVGRVQLGYDRTMWVAEATHQMDYWITVGDTPAKLVANYVDATGHTPAFPEWASGFWQCKLRYATQDELLGVAREHKRRGLPISVIVADFFHWTVQGEWKFDPAKWPDPAGMVRELDQMGIKLMVSIWPTVNPLSENWEEMRRRGLLVRQEGGIPVQMQFVDNKPEGPVFLQFVDTTHPEARRFLWERARDNYHRHGIHIFWLDEAEPDMWPMHPYNLRYHLGNGMEVTNLYPLFYAQGFCEGMRAEGQQEILNLCRCAWTGSQRFGAAIWSGDINSNWEALRAQVRAGLNMGLSGIPWWTADIGGFFGGDPSTPYFREMIVRWFQYGVFCPIFRLHGYREPTQWYPVMQGGPNEVWSFGDEAYTIIKELLFLRERLRPYIMDQMRLAQANGTPLMRPLFFEFPGDPDCRPVDDAFMFGPDLLVAPVLDEGARSRRVYLPVGTRWTDAWTGKKLDGGQWITADAPLERIPLYLRGGAHLPITNP